MSISLEEVISNGLVSQEILKYIPLVCPTCGTEVVFSDSLKQISCPNRYCPDKVAARLEAMAKTMKVDGWGEATCQAVCKQFRLHSPYQVYLLEGHHFDGVATFEKKVAGFLNAPKRSCELWEMVQFGGIPAIATTAYKIFGGYSSIDAAYADIEAYQAPWVAEKLGLKSSESGVMAVNVYNTLLEYKGELQFAETQFNIVSKEGVPVHIAITGGVIGFTNKAEYVEHLNRRFAGKLNIMLMNSVTASVSFLVADHDTSSRKYQKALRMQEKGDSIIITDSEELPELLDMLVQQLEQAG